MEGKFIFNYNTIVWHAPNPKNVSCETNVLLEGQGQFSLTADKTRGRLLDDSKQIEVLFHNELINVCRPGMTPQIEGYTVMGIPDTFLILSDPNDSERRKRSIESLDYDTDNELEQTNINYLMKSRQLDINQQLYNMSYAWGQIRNFVIDEQGTLTSFENQMEMVIAPPLTPGLPITRKANQQFVYIIDQTIRRNNPDYNSTSCLTLKSYLFLTLDECSYNSSKWIYDKHSGQLIEEKTLW